MKLEEHEETGTTLEQLPELPRDVQVPDDIRGMPTAPRPVDGPVRWIRWLAAVLMVGLVGVMGAVLFFSGEAEETVTMDPMERYGTDNPVVVDADAVPGSVMVISSVDFLEQYGTDNPVIVGEATVTPEADGELSYLERYGTDNPVIVGGETTPAVVDTMDLYGTDNPVFEGRTWMEQYGTDNPDFGG